MAQKANVVKPGSKVTYQLDDEPVTVVLRDREHPAHPIGSVAASAPLPAALMGHRVGDSFKFQSENPATPVRTVTVLKVV